MVSDRTKKTKPVRRPIWLHPHDWEALDAFAESEERTVSFLLRQLIRSTIPHRYHDVVNGCTQGAPKVQVGCTSGAPEVPTHSPARARESSTPDQKEKKKEKKRDLDLEVVRRVIARVNEHRPLRGRQQPFNPERFDEGIRALLRKGFKEADLLLVVDHKAGECRRNGNWSWYKPDTLFRPTKFKEKLGAAEAGVEIKPLQFQPRDALSRTIQMQKQATKEDWENTDV